MSKTEIDRYITINVFCDRYSVDKSTVYRFMHQYKPLPHIHIGKNGRWVRIPEQAAHAWMLEQAEVG